MPVNPVEPMELDKVRLFFITPAHERYALSDICFRQKREEIDRLKSLGVDAECVVIACDENLRIAAEHGHRVIEQDNEFLGRRWNDGWQYAAENGATHVMPVGSDSWVQMDWALLAGFPPPGIVLCNRNYNVVHRNGTRRASIWIGVEYGVHFVCPVENAAKVGYRPCREELQSGCDTATIRRIMPVKFDFREAHRLEAVAFQSRPQITNYNRLMSKWGRGETFDPFSDLVPLYGAKLTHDIREFYAGQLAREREFNMENAEGQIQERTAWMLLDEIAKLRADLQVRGIV